MAEASDPVPGPGEPAAEDKSLASASRNARYGLWLFLVYVVMYGGFVLLSAFAPRVMAAAPLGRVNVAVLYGFGLIAAALVLALIYMYLCRREVPTGPARPESPEGGR